MLLNLLNKLLGRKTQQFSKYKIEFHSRYNGTYMLFGLDVTNLQWLLVDISDNPQKNLEWSEQFNCEQVQDYTLRENPQTGAEELVPQFANCTCCR